MHYDAETSDLIVDVQIYDKSKMLVENESKKNINKLTDLCIGSI